MNIYKDSDSGPQVLAGRRTVILGYGNQGRPQALNLRDSGIDVGVAARKGGKGWRKAEADGFEPLEIERGVEEADVLLMLLPDEIQSEVFDETVSKLLRPGSTLCFAHGFTIAFGGIESRDHDIILVAPKGQGAELRRAYLRGTGLPCLVGVDSDVTGSAMETALAIAWGLGCLRVGGFDTTFREEAVSDLFGEQAVLCGGLTALVKKAWQLLVDRGFSPEVAYFECVQELKIIVDLFSEKGLHGMREMISGTAAYGGLKYGERVITPDSEKVMEELFDRIDSGEFARDWLETARSGKGELGQLIEVERKLDIEDAGASVRRLFEESDKRREK